MKTKTFAEALLQIIKEGLEYIGISRELLDKADTIIYLIVILFIAWIIGKLTHRVVLYVLNRILKHKKILLLSKLIEYDALRKLSLIIPPLIVLALLPFAFEGDPKELNLLEKITGIYFIVVLSISISAILSSVGSTTFLHEKNHDRPVKGFIQILQICVWCLAAIVIISIIVNKSPFYLITGLSAFAAILMLIFKDSLLGLVGGILLMQNDMIRLGDWIQMPGTGIDGYVIDISLTIVKVRNFDNTIATIPPYSLISGSFINWRGMKESGARRITTQITLMYDYIKPCTSDFLTRMRRFDTELSHFIDEMQQPQEKPHATAGTIETNVGLLRAYMTLYLRRHPLINQDILMMVRLMEPEYYGLPIQIYCFANDTVWSNYENIMAQIVEHFLSILPQFELFATQATTSRDYVISSLLKSGVPLHRIDHLPLNTVKENIPSHSHSHSLPKENEEKVH